MVCSPRSFPGRLSIPARVPKTAVAISISIKARRIFVMWDLAFASFMSMARLATMEVTRIGITVIWKRLR